MLWVFTGGAVVWWFPNYLTTLDVRQKQVLVFCQHLTYFASSIWVFQRNVVSFAHVCTIPKSQAAAPFSENLGNRAQISRSSCSPLPWWVFHCAWPWSPTYGLLSDTFADTSKWHYTSRTGWSTCPAPESMLSICLHYLGATGTPRRSHYHRCLADPTWSHLWFQDLSRILRKTSSNKALVLTSTIPALTIMLAFLNAALGWTNKMGLV